jgi:glycosyltransferase involved in cell wall biosynthesis
VSRPPATSAALAERAASLAERFPRVAISHEWLTVPGGSEKVVLGLLELFPRAELFTSVYDPEPWPSEITGRAVHASFLNRVPQAKRIYPKLLPLMNAAFRSFDLSGFDLVVSSNHSCAKNVRVPTGALHVCYCHTPMRHAWEPRFIELERIGPVGRLLLPPLLRRLRRQDLAAAAGPDLFVANSRHVATRIANYYGRDARVIHPPVEVDRFLGVPRRPSDYYLFLGRLVPYKRADMAVAACARLGRPLKVVGGGRAAAELRSLAGPDTEFLGEVSDERVEELLSGARALLFPGEEDFGIVPVEAQAAGVPVVAYGVGGARDSVIHGETGILYDEHSADGLAEAMLELEDRSLDEDAIRSNARRFAPERFHERFADLMEELR